MMYSGKGQGASGAAFPGDRGTDPGQAAGPGRGFAWRPALRWVGLVLVMVALAIFHVGQQRPDTSGCDASIPRFPAPGDPPDYVSVVACGELVFEGSREAAERFLRHAVEGPPTAVYTAAAAGLAVLGAALIALGNVGAPARRRMSPDGRVRLVAAGGAVGLAVGVVTSAVVHPVMYDRGLLMYTDQLLDLVFLVPAYMILGAVFGATYRPVAR